MIIINKNEGEKIPYTVNNKKTSICFDDDLTINLSKREKDDPVHIDICYDRDENLVIGAAAGRYYVAEIDIPAREYEEVETEESTEATGETDGETADPDGGMDGGTQRVPLPLDMSKVTLTLWSIEEA